MGILYGDAAGAGFTEDEVGGLLAALAFAAAKHQEQRRKGRGHEPYINHPIRVVEILWEVGGVRDPATLAAAFLHDTLEDTATTPAELAARFGQVVTALVEEMTDDKSLPKTVRKQQQIAHAPRHSPRAKQIKLADKIQNVRDLITSPPSDWSLDRLYAYVDWADQVVAGLRGANPAMEAVYDEVTTQARQQFAKTL